MEMFEPSDSQFRHLSRQSLQKRYESDEEDMSESDAGHDFVPSLVGSQQAAEALDSDLSADENPLKYPDSDREKNLRAPYPAKRPRPVSIDTVKRSSDTTFAEDNYVFDPEGELILEIPSPDSTPVLASGILIRPTIYVQPESPPIRSTSRTRSSSPSSIFSMENAEIQIARKITMIEPPNRPLLVFIKSRAKSAKTKPNTRSRGNTRDRDSPIFMGEHLLDIPCQDLKPTAARDRALAEHEQATVKLMDKSLPREISQSAQALSATINRVSEIPDTFYLPPSPRMRPQPDFQSRLHASGLEKPQADFARPRRPTESSSRRPASIRSSSNSSVQSYSSRSTSPFPEDPHHGYVPEKNDSASFTRSCSPISLTSTTLYPAQRAPTPSHSVSNLLTHRPPMMRRMTRKHSTSSSVHSMSSLRSEMDMSIAPAPLHPQSKSPSKHDLHIVRKSSQSRHARHSSSNHTSRGFMGLKLGKRAFRV
ncbi:hypothetical protein N7495_001288 [Penicillium taxi]|uniref:uncharacterized protein n=1 Tax=Penicillium taxi TaxID=168475 RepID=UPI0025453795|nr:uncharacterized protein N7495_001288 [Penicillium taxi]KAJ5908606.1 hypothetical protein N7495_001288 [Penicillium taxi]